MVELTTNTAYIQKNARLGCAAFQETVMEKS